VNRLLQLLTLGLVLASLAIGAADARDKPLAVGDRVADFTLRDQDGKPTKLSELLARRDLVVVAFYIQADSPG
jgi:cytochrome oxidase Cu insertion factor (SCO1/SenC/PrrC family)